MRPIGYVAATAAGLIAPIALALPAIAGTQSHLPGSIGGIVKSVDGYDDPGNGPDNGYDNGDGNGPDNGYNGPDNNYDNGDNPDVGIFSSGSAATGNVSLVVSLDNGGPYNEYVLTSPSMEAGCEANNVTGALAETDRFGHLNVTGEAKNCIPGNYLVTVAQTGGAEETYYDTVTIH